MYLKKNLPYPSFCKEREQKGENQKPQTQMFEGNLQKTICPSLFFPRPLITQTPVELLLRMLLLKESFPLVTVFSFIL